MKIKMGQYTAKSFIGADIRVAERAIKYDAFYYNGRIVDCIRVTDPKSKYFVMDTNYSATRLRVAVKDDIITELIGLG
jgi:hypothetical protein